MDTLENKAKLFAQYWGQKICNFHFQEVGLDTVNVSTLLKNGTELDNWCLELKPLSSISDEDAVEFFSILIGTIIPIEDRINWIKNNLSRVKSSRECSDYLRSKGYALDWNGITVKQQIEYGWVKLQCEHKWRRTGDPDRQSVRCELCGIITE